MAEKLTESGSKHRYGLNSPEVIQSANMVVAPAYYRIPET